MPQEGRLLHPGDVTVDTPITFTTSGTNNTSADVWTDVFTTAAGRRELPLLVLLSTFLVWRTALMAERHHSSHNSFDRPGID